MSDLKDGKLTHQQTPSRRKAVPPNPFRCQAKPPNPAPTTPMLLRHEAASSKSGRSRRKMPARKSRCITLAGSRRRF